MSAFQNSISNCLTIEELVRNHIPVVSEATTRNMSNVTQFIGYTEELRRHVDECDRDRVDLPSETRDLLRQAEHLVTVLSTTILSANGPIGFRNDAA